MTNGIRLTDEEANVIRLILLDHKDCLQREDYPMTCGKAVKEALEKNGIDASEVDEEEIDSKANLIWEIDQLVERLEGKEGEEE